MEGIEHLQSEIEFRVVHQVPTDIPVVDSHRAETRRNAFNLDPSSRRQTPHNMLARGESLCGVYLVSHQRLEWKRIDEDKLTCEHSCLADVLSRCFGAASRQSNPASTAKTQKRRSQTGEDCTSHVLLTGPFAQPDWLIAPGCMDGARAGRCGGARPVFRRSADASKESPVAEAVRLSCLVRLMPNETLTRSAILEIRFPFLGDGLSDFSRLPLLKAARIAPRVPSCPPARAR